MRLKAEVPVPAEMDVFGVTLRDCVGCEKMSDAEDCDGFSDVGV